MKSKPQAATSESREENVRNESTDNGKSQWQTRRFVTWEPRLHIGPFGLFHSHLTPVVYNVAYRSSSTSSLSGADSGCSLSAKGEEEAKKTTQGQAASPTAVPVRDEHLSSSIETATAQQ